MAYIISQLVIISKVATCTSWQVACNGHPSTCGHLTGLWNKSYEKQILEKADQSILGSGVVVNSLLMELSIGDEKHSLLLCAYVVGFGKTCHLYTLSLKSAASIFVAMYISVIYIPHGCVMCIHTWYYIANYFKFIRKLYIIIIYNF